MKFPCHCEGLVLRESYVNEGLHIFFLVIRVNSCRFVGAELFGAVRGLLGIFDPDLRKLRFKCGTLIIKCLLKWVIGDSRCLWSLIVINSFARLDINELAFFTDRLQLLGKP